MADIDWTGASLTREERFRQAGMLYAVLGTLVILVTMVLGAREWSRFRARTDLGPDRARLANIANIDLALVIKLRFGQTFFKQRPLAFLLHSLE